MNKLRQTPFSILVTLLCLITIGAFGQTQTKTFNETFMVSKTAILEIDTSHADIEFETWSKDQVEIEAVIEIEGASDEEAAQYIEDSGFKILGNSQKVTISTGNNLQSFRSNRLSDLQNFHIDIPDIPEVTAFNFDFEELTNMPVLPINPKTAFDHKAFKKDGKKYLKKWQKDFEASFDKEHTEKLELWAKKMEERQEKMQKRRKEMMGKRTEMMAKRDERRQERMEKMEEAPEKHLQLRLERQLQNNKGSSRIMIINGDSISTGSNGGPNIFYGSSNGSSKNYKVKKSIKVKMPKGMKIKMDVRHGDVKLADNTWHMNAKLSHSSLWAASIDGNKTTIHASYSPVNVERWLLGNLQANYSESIHLKEVFEIKLNTKSSNVTIDKLLKSAFVNNDFGALKIEAITKDFTDLDVTMQNAELDLTTPNIAFDIYANGTSSEFSSPEKIVLETTKNHNNSIHKGYFRSKNSGNTITINSKYSEVVVK